MVTLAQTVLPFKVEATDEMLTAKAGLALFGAPCRSVGIEGRRRYRRTIPYHPQPEFRLQHHSGPTLA